jgi:hypothetical protein
MLETDRPSFERKQTGLIQVAGGLLITAIISVFFFHRQIGMAVISVALAAFMLVFWFVRRMRFAHALRSSGG